jgi:hypothetical protein
VKTDWEKEEGDGLKSFGEIVILRRKEKGEADEAKMRVVNAVERNEKTFGLRKKT